MSHNEFDLLSEFDDFLDAVHDEVEIMGLTFLPNEILKTDEVAYRESFLNWCDANNYDF